MFQSQYSNDLLLLLDRLLSRQNFFGQKELIPSGSPPLLIGWCDQLSSYPPIPVTRPYTLIFLYRLYTQSLSYLNIHRIYISQNFDFCTTLIIFLNIFHTNQERNTSISSILSSVKTHCNPNFSPCRVLPDINLEKLRSEISRQLDMSEIPQSFIFLKNVGRHFAMVS